MPTTNGGSHRIFYEVAGPSDAPPVLLIMGFGLSSRGWSDLPARLAERFRVVVFDNRGMGQSTRPLGLFSMAHMADDAAHVLDAANIERAHVFGISMGGMIAQELALRHPQRVQSLVLGCTHASWLRHHRPTLSTVGALLGGVLLRTPASRMRLASILVSAELIEKQPERFADWVKRSEPATAMMTALQIAAVVGHCTESRLAKLDRPTLIITGAEDRLIPPENSRKLARLIPGAKLVELGGTGHCFPLEQPDATVAELTRFFDANGRSTVTS
ncbi:alpha/beta hydrolase [Pendulispora brunnea]|uniref:Alpha/beta hydrolase n=1 Tax=Pendulispora brunnea TaxID=2905690 RepID=A0ABZ2JVJ1_9BACT